MVHLLVVLDGECSPRLNGAGKALLRRLSFPPFAQSDSGAFLLPGTKCDEYHTSVGAVLVKTGVHWG